MSEKVVVFSRIRKIILVRCVVFCMMFFKILRFRCVLKFVSSIVFIVFIVVVFVGEVIFFRIDFKIVIMSSKGKKKVLNSFD